MPDDRRKPPRRRPRREGRGRPHREPPRTEGGQGGDPRGSERGERPRKPWSPAGGQLPNWVGEQLARVTPKGNLAAATEHLVGAATYFSSGKYGKALSEAEQAKQLSSRDATIREILALSAYRLGRWDLALRELRTFRRLTGESTHMPVEMDVLRALDRPDDVEATWKLFNDIGGRPDTRREAKVVFGSHLLETGDARRAWEITNPKRMTADPGESELRVWYVASKAAHRLGDAATARQLFEAIERADAAFPGLDELGRLLRND